MIIEKEIVIINEIDSLFNKSNKFLIIDIIHLWVN